MQNRERLVDQASQSQEREESCIVGAEIRAAGEEVTGSGRVESGVGYRLRG